MFPKLFIPRVSLGKPGKHNRLPAEPLVRRWIYFSVQRAAWDYKIEVL